MSSIVIDLKDCKTVLDFLDRFVKELKLMPFYGANLEILAKTLASLEKHGFTFPLVLKLINVHEYKEKCPNGWNIFLNSLEKAKEEFAKREQEFNWEIDS